MGGQTTGNQSHSTTTVLPPNQQTNVDTLLQDALANYQSGGPKYYQGSTVAPVNANQTAGMAGAVDYATGAGASNVNAAQGANNYWMSPNVLTDYSKIPGYDASRQNIINGATQNLSEGVLPTIRGDAILNGQYGGTSQQIGEALATSRTNEAIAGQLGNLDLGLYNTNVNAQQQALNRAPAMYDLGLKPSQTQAQVGDNQRALDQEGIDADVKAWNFDQMRPLMNMQALQALTGTAGTYGGTQYGTGATGTSPDTGSQIMQVLGTVIMAYAMSGSHPILKTDIVKADGFLAGLRKLEINRWTYKHDETSVKHVGPMADQFREIFGVGDGVTLNIFDLMGVMLGAMKEIAEVSHGN